MAGRPGRSGRKPKGTEAHVLAGSYRKDLHGPVPLGLSLDRSKSYRWRHGGKCANCGNPTCLRSLRCLPCHRRYTAAKVRVCVHCGCDVLGRGNGIRTCSYACFLARKLSLAEKHRKLGSRAERARQRRRRASFRRKARGGKLEVGRWRRICERDCWVCWVCGGGIDPTLAVPHRLAGTADHVIALLDGGSDTDGNIKAAHMTCNSRRGRLERLSRPEGVS